MPNQKKKEFTSRNYYYLLALTMISREEQLESCKICKNRKFDFKHGIICGLTNEKADFAFECANINIDVNLKLIEENKKNTIEQERLSIKTGGMSSFGITNGAIAGVILISISIVWLALGIILIKRIFFYPIIILIVGIGIIIYHFINLAKQKNKEYKKSRQDDIVDV